MEAQKFLGSCVVRPMDGYAGPGHQILKNDHNMPEKFDLSFLVQPWEVSGLY